MPDDLRTWADLHAAKGNLMAKRVLYLFARLEAAELAGRCSAERVQELDGTNARLVNGQRALLAKITELEAELAAARKRCDGLAERVAKQSDLLTRRAEKPVRIATPSFPPQPSSDAGC